MKCVKCGETVGPGGMLWLDDDGDPVCSACANDSGQTSKLSAALVRIRDLEEDVAIYNKIDRIHRRTLDALGAPMAASRGVDDTDTAARIRALADMLKADSANDERVSGAAIQHGTMLGVLRALAVEHWGARHAMENLQVAVHGACGPMHT